MAYLQKRLRKRLIGSVVREGFFGIVLLAAFLYWAWLVGDSLDSWKEHSDGLWRVLVNVGLFIASIVLLVGILRRLYRGMVAMMHPDLYKLSYGSGDVSIYIAKIEHATASLGRLHNLDAFEDCLVVLLRGKFVIFPWHGLKLVTFRESTGENEEGGLEMIFSGIGVLNLPVMTLNIYDYSLMQDLVEFFKEHAPRISFVLDELARERFEFAGIEV